MGSGFLRYSVAVGLTEVFADDRRTSRAGGGKLSRQKVIVKRDAIQNFGAMDIPVHRQNRHTDAGQNCAGESYWSISGGQRHVLHCAQLNSRYRTGHKIYWIRGSHTEGSGARNRRAPARTLAENR